METTELVLRPSKTGEETTFEVIGDAVGTMAKAFPDLATNALRLTVQGPQKVALPGPLSAPQLNDWLKNLCDDGYEFSVADAEGHPVELPVS